MTDALTNAERLLRKAGRRYDDMLGWSSEEGEACHAAADALAAERERRGEPECECVVTELSPRCPVHGKYAATPPARAGEPSEAMVEAVWRKLCEIAPIHFWEPMDANLRAEKMKGVRELCAALAAQEGAR